MVVFCKPDMANELGCAADAVRIELDIQPTEMPITNVDAGACAATILDRVEEKLTEDDGLPIPWYYFVVEILWKTIYEFLVEAYVNEVYIGRVHWSTIKHLITLPVSGMDDLGRTSDADRLLEQLKRERKRRDC